MKQHYVLGISINKERTQVLLIKKTKPAWQLGLVNAIGGKIEAGETPLQAMVREYKEETDLDTIEQQWTELVVQENEYFKMFVFYMIDDCIHNAVTTTEEEVFVHNIDIDYLKYNGVDNLYLLVSEVLYT